MSSELSAFSDCGQLFAFSGSDGKLRVWDAASGSVKQEFAPSVQLSTPCTSLNWVPVSLKEHAVGARRSKRKRKYESKSSDSIVIGTANGTIATYSLAEGKILMKLDEGSALPVHSLCWTRGGTLFSSANNLIVQWDLDKAEVFKKWKSGKHKLTAIAASADGELLVAGCFKLTVWNARSQCLVKEFTGHVSEVAGLAFAGSQYFLSCGSTERHINVWNVNGVKDEPVAKFALNDCLRGEISVFESSGSIYVAATTQNGCLHYYKHQLNGKISKVIKPTQTVEILSEPKGASSTSLPIHSVCLTSVNTAQIAYGHPPMFSFESIKLCEGKENRIRLIRAEQVKAITSNNVNKVASEATNDVDYVSGGSRVKRKQQANLNDVPMEERLGNLSLDYRDSTGVGKPSPHNMSQLLIQGLESNDKNILNTVLRKSDPETLNETVSRLPIHVLSPLVQELVHRMHSKTFTVIQGVLWMKTVMRIHSAQIVNDTKACEQLLSLQSLIDSRISLVGPLSRLSGRLSHVLYHQMEAPHFKSLANLEPIVLYQDEESDDDGGSLLIDTDGNDSEEKWDELSGQEESETAAT